MRDIVLSVVSQEETGTRPVLAFTSYPVLRPFSVGPGEVNLLCGRCRFVLIAGEKAGTERPRMLIRCPACGDSNDPRHPDG